MYCIGKLKILLRITIFIVLILLVLLKALGEILFYKLAKLLKQELKYIKFMNAI